MFFKDDCFSLNLFIDFFQNIIKYRTRVTLDQDLKWDKILEPDQSGSE